MSLKLRWYEQGMDAGYPGMKASTAVDTVRSFAAEGGVNPGDPVMRGSDPDRQIKAVTAAADAAKAIGIAVHTHREPRDPYYEEGYAVPVMTMGDIYIEVAGEVTAGAKAALLAGAEGKLGYVASGVSGAVDLPGITYLESGVAGDLVAVHIKE